MKNDTLLALITLLSPISLCQAAHSPEKESCLNLVFSGRLENVTDSRSLWSMLTDPTKAYFLQSPEQAYIQCLQKHPEARELVTRKVEKNEKGWITSDTVSATIGNTIIEELDAHKGKTAKRISQDGKEIAAQSISHGAKIDTLNKLNLIYYWQEELKRQEREAQKEAARKVSLPNEDFLKKISSSKE